MTNQLTDTRPDTHRSSATTTRGAAPIRSIPPTSGRALRRLRRDRPRRRLLAGGLALVAAAVVVTVAPGDGADGTVEQAAGQRSASIIIEGEIDAALTERATSPGRSIPQPAYLVIQNEIDSAAAERRGMAEAPRSTAQIVQDEIDAALAERAGANDEEPAYLVIQGEIDAALAERGRASTD